MEYQLKLNGTCLSINHCLSVFDCFVGLALNGIIFLLLYIMFDLYLYFFINFIFTFTLDRKFICCKLFSEINYLLSLLTYALCKLCFKFWKFQKIYEKQPPVLLFLMFHMTFCISRYDFSKNFGTSLNIIILYIVHILLFLWINFPSILNPFMRRF